MDYTANFYSRPSYDFQGGAGFPIYSGSRRQRGGSVFGTLKSLFIPVAKDVGKAALVSGIALAQDVIRDKLAGKNIKDSILSHGKQRGLDLVKTAVKTAAQQGMLGKLTGMIGKGRRRRRRRQGRRLQSKRRPISRKSTTSRKRRKRAKSAPKRNAKRRRIAANF